ncbi:MAG: hypothetical protein F4W90_03465 [Gammaproteobacteria bacterium]|nr:hypothetical protein [Gammaproteobacteria bacterium]
MLTRRQTLIGAATLPVLSAIGGLPDATKEALESSRLIYLTPLKSDGTESACKGEVWFSYDGDMGIHVVTQYGAWRANAIRKGMNSARIWVGEYGVWTSAGDSFRQGPELMISGVFETDPEIQRGVLNRMGGKYSDEWGVWGPRFKNGLADNSRVMMRYTIG